MSPEKARMLRRVGVGALLGLGAPAGYFVLEVIHSGLHGHALAEFCWRLIPEQLPLFLYLTIPTVCVFTAFAAYTAVQEHKLKKQKDQMEAFLLVASHDIKSPLMVIREGLNMIGELSPLPELSKKLLTASSRQAEIMTELVTELLDIQRMEHGKGMEAAELMEIKDILRHAVEEMSPQLEKKHVTVRWESHVPAAAVNVNAFRIRQVVRNLLGNAIRYTPEGSAITVRLDSAPSDQVRVSIQNNGPKIPEAHLRTIFDKFTQSSIRDYKLGHGLGLVICKSIIEGFKGRIWAENLEPTGVTFNFELPIAKNPS